MGSYFVESDIQLLRRADELEQAKSIECDCLQFML